MVAEGTAASVRNAIEAATRWYDNHYALWDFAGLIFRLIEGVAMILVFAYAAMHCDEIGSRVSMIATFPMFIVATWLLLRGINEETPMSWRALAWAGIAGTALFTLSYVPARDPAITESKIPVVAFHGKTNIGHRLWVVPFSKDAVVLKDFEAKTEATLRNRHVATVRARFAIVPDESRVLAAVRVGDPEGRMRNVAEKSLAAAATLALSCPSRIDRSTREDAALMRERESDLPMRLVGNVSVELLYDSLVSEPATCE